MSETIVSGRTWRVNALTRVEGEGALILGTGPDGGVEAKLNIFEPPRFFEAILKGRHFREVPDITARICGICPVAYQMTAAQAFESALGVEVGSEIRMLRRLMVLAEWLESHALHIYLLQAPDFLGYESAISLASDHPAIVERGLGLKRACTTLLELLGGRASHPVSVCVGGFHRVPTRAELLTRRDSLAQALDAAVATLATVSAFDFPPLEIDYEFVALDHPHEYAVNEGRILSSRGLDIAVAEYGTHFREEQVAHSTALHSVRAETGTSYFVGPLARVNLHAARLLPTAREAARTCGVAWPSRNPFHGIVARAIEVIQACEEALALMDAYREPASAQVAVPVHAAMGCAATEAPRGILYHRYEIDEQGLVRTAKIIPPTAQNLRRMEDDLQVLVPPILDRGDAEILRQSENLVRTYDPCISCSTHFLKLRRSAP
ncbi:MAG: Ni/Fe hydrogenase subunit alpha [Thermoanaerobaculia bacterium]